MMHKRDQRDHTKIRMFVIFAMKLVGRTDLSDLFRKIIIRYKRNGYSLKVTRQSACLVFNPMSINNYAPLFKRTPVGRASYSMMAPT